MPDRLTSRAALAVLLLLLTIAGIRAAGPAVSIRHVALAVVIGIGCALEAVLAVLLIALRWRPRGSAGAAAARLRLLLTGVIVTGLIAVPAAMLIAGFTHIRPRRRLREHRTGFGGHPTRLHLGRHGHAATGGVYVQYVLFALLIMAIIVAAILIWRRRRWLLSARSPEVTGEDTDTPAELARAVDSGRVALRELDDARAAIIGCYLAMEESLADVGAARDAAETPDELLDRAAGAGVVDAAPAGRLTALFYEARFSTHPMPPARRDDAEHALADMAASLSPHNQAPASAAPSEGQR